jgi:hypothetical protein
MLVREWFALRFLQSNAWMLVLGEQEWKPLWEFSEIYLLKDGTCRSGDASEYYNSPDRYQKPSTPSQRAYLHHLGCPFPVEDLDFHLAERLIRQISGACPFRVEPEMESQIEDERNDPNFWHCDPASEKQRAYLQTIGIHLSADATKGEAACLIDPASDAQRRRLNFYGSRLPQFLTKQYASKMIDDHIQRRPESEGPYQQWKRDNGIT